VYRYIKVHKLNIQVLPCIVFFRNGVAYDRIVGFEELGARDDWKTSQLENMLLTGGIIALPEKGEDDSEDEVGGSTYYKPFYLSSETVLPIN
jgi:hypothetical protein